VLDLVQTFLTQELHQNFLQQGKRTRWTVAANPDFGKSKNCLGKSIVVARREQIQALEERTNEKEGNHQAGMLFLRWQEEEGGGAGEQWIIIRVFSLCLC